ncbi:MAG: transposase [Chloroflexota bacterium]
MAYHQAEAAGIPVWCQDEAGPYQAIPQPGARWQAKGHPQRQPHEYLRGGTAKLLNLFRPATGEVRARGVTSSANVVLHPWLRAELTSILAQVPPAPACPTAALPAVRRWETWLGQPPREPLPPLRLILVWDNLAGHKSQALVDWLLRQGVVPLYTPLSGSWLNMAESVQHILGARALAGQHPQSSAEIIAWLEATVVGWNRAPTPFAWGGKRQERRERARTRWRAHRLRGSGATCQFSMPIAA